MARFLAKPVDVFICCASFEARSLAVASCMDRELVSAALIVRNRDALALVGENAERLELLFGDRAMPVEMSTEDPLFTTDRILEALAEQRGKGHRSFLIDVTTFTHEALLVLARLLRDFGSNSERHLFVYTGARDYSIGDSKKTKWLSKGCRAIRNVVSYAGELRASRKTHLIALVGFEHERASNLIDEFDPEVLSLGYGSSSVLEKHRVANAHFHKMLLRYAGTRTYLHDFDFSCQSPVDCKYKIRDQIEKFPAHNTVIAPINNKISTLGAALVAFEDETVQLCYVQPEEYNHRGYSAPAQRYYVFTLW